MAVETSEEIADRFLVALEGTLMPLREFPLSGVSREEFAPGLRVVFHGGYALYYKPFPDAVVVIRVLHGAREARVLAERGGFKL